MIFMNQCLCECVCLCVCVCVCYCALVYEQLWTGPCVDTKYKDPIQQKKMMLA